MPPTQLYEDVWIEIIQQYVSRRDVLSSLARTSRRMRELALPRLYRELAVTFNEHSSPETDTLLCLSRILCRLEALQGQSHLLAHVREFKILFASPPEWQKSCVPLWSTTYEAATRLLLKLPQIIRLQLSHCLVTPRICSFICQHNTLRSLSLWVCRHETGTITERDALDHGSLRLEELTYRQRENWPFPCQLLERSASSLTSLAIPHAEVPRVVAVVGQSLPSLRNLAITTYPSDRNRSAEITRLLERCSGLRSVDVRTLGPGLGPFHVDIASLRSGALPHLESVCGDLHVVLALIPGRPVRHITIYDVNSARIRSSDVQLLRASTVQITDVTVEISKQATLSDGQLIHLGCAFPHVQSLKFFFNFGGQTDGAMHTIAKFVLQWPRLRTLSLLFQHFTRFTASFMQRNAPPPRGHPFLRKIDFQTSGGGFAWLWFPEDADWVLREREPSREDCKLLNT